MTPADTWRNEQWKLNEKIQLVQNLFSHTSLSNQAKLSLSEL